MEYNICGDCKYCNRQRKNYQGQVRCTRLSQFVNSNDKCCNYFLSKKKYEALEALSDELYQT